MKVLQNNANMRFCTKRRPMRQKFVCHRVQMRSLNEVKIFKCTCCTKKGSTRVFLWYSEAD